MFSFNCRFSVGTLSTPRHRRWSSNSDGITRWCNGSV